MQLQLRVLLFWLCDSLLDLRLSIFSIWTFTYMSFLIKQFVMSKTGNSSGPIFVRCYGQVVLIFMLFWDCSAEITLLECSLLPVCKKTEKRATQTIKNKMMNETRKGVQLEGYTAFCVPICEQTPRKKKDWSCLAAKEHSNKTRCRFPLYTTVLK